MFLELWLVKKYNSVCIAQHKVARRNFKGAINHLKLALMSFHASQLTFTNKFRSVWARLKMLFHSASPILNCPTEIDYITPDAVPPFTSLSVLQRG